MFAKNKLPSSVGIITDSDCELEDIDEEDEDMGRLSSSMSKLTKDLNN